MLSFGATTLYQQSKAPVGKFCEKKNVRERFDAAIAQHKAQHQLADSELHDVYLPNNQRLVVDREDIPKFAADILKLVNDLRAGKYRPKGIRGVLLDARMALANQTWGTTPFSTLEHWVADDWTKKPTTHIVDLDA
jgi:hypothetical protein